METNFQTHTGWMQAIYDQNKQVVNCFTSRVATLESRFNGAGAGSFACGMEAAYQGSTINTPSR
ncbi:hypothetical protein M408DRAFT_327557 [Serendipita vermifera MAFF 305830]|uniref:Uncharacterized protein n=1 Tax=Serendipita vermifera MAFF 305830 TaxID=933852 RepID=A0A0C3BIH2_SERVB|nr:hypothetical protein M408DRAFT_327557 [Serendipita vermifera MAFF 305830]